MYKIKNIYFARDISELNSLFPCESAAVTVASKTSLSMLIPLLKSIACNQKNKLDFYILNDFIEIEDSSILLNCDCSYISDQYVRSHPANAFDIISNKILNNNILFKFQKDTTNFYKSYFFEWIIRLFSNTKVRIIFANYNNLLKSNNIPELSLAAKSQSRFINNIYLKFFLPRFFFKAQNLIYIDVDTLVLSDLTDLSLLKFDKNQYYAMSQHIYYSKNIVNKRPIHSKFIDLCNNTLKIPITRYFNSGIVVYDIQSCNKNNIPELWVKLYNKHKSEILFNEQDIMNILTDNILALPLQYGARETDMKWYNLDISLSKRQVLVDGFLRDIKIVHYYGPKSYDYCPNLDNKIWWDYALSTPFSRFNTLFNLISKT